MTKSARPEIGASCTMLTSAPEAALSLIMDGRPFDRAIALQYGLRQHEVTDLVVMGAVRHVVRGVYLDAQVPDDLASRAACLRLRLPPYAVVTRLTAAWLWGVDGRMPEQLAAPPPVECVVPPGRQPVRRPGVRCYTAALDAETTEIDGVPVTTPVRTAVDVMRWLPPHMGLAIADALAGKGLVAPSELVARVEESRGFRGIAQARYLAALVEPATESFGESWLRLRIIDAGFPRPSVQIEVLDSTGRCLYRMDLGWEDRRIAVEYDGEAYHSTRGQIAHDLHRRGQLESVYGWRLLAVGRGEVLGRSLALEKGVGELLSMEPRTLRRRW
jgi:hypothetical protein